MSVGLSPLHVGGIFLSECVIYAFLSSSLGYLLGIAASWVLNYLKMFPADLYPNYSSTFIFLALTLAEGVTLLAAAYPSYKASRLVTPSMERRWKIPKPHGDTYHVRFPFIIMKEEISGLFAFINEYISMYGSEKVGTFSTEQVRYSEKNVNGENIGTLTARVRLAPFELGTIQDVLIIARAPQGKNYSVELEIHRVEGVYDVWTRSNEKYIDIIRKQILLWGSLSHKEKERYKEE